ncbi:MAG TPA: FGGY family carbohydrate kinase [Candidatus Baltobacterales bacterium]|nr:FGGY family carbohydrate kinase [Candidatus Baltobacterales bacterium]
MELLVGVDVGSQSTKTAIYDIDGRTVAEAVVDTPLKWSGSQSVEQDPEGFYSATLRTIRECVSGAGIAPDSVLAIGIAGQMAGVLGIGADGLPTTEYDSWLDARCKQEVEFLERNAGDLIIERTGCAAMIDHAPKIRWWARQHPDVFSRTVKFVVPSAYVAARLSALPAEEAYVDRTHLHFTGLADAAKCAWSEELAALVGVPLDKLPRIVDPTELIGTLSPEAASETGLLPGTPVAAGLGDTAAGALGAGIVEPGQVLDTAGTASVLAVCTDGFRPDTRTRTLIAMQGALPGQWISLSYLAGGTLVTWLQGLLVGHADDAALQLLLDEAERVSPGADGVLFCPYVGGRILPAAPAARGGWSGLNFHHGRGHLVRAALESVAFEYDRYLSAALDLFPELKPCEVRVIGGGASSQLWNRIKASVLGLPFLRLDRKNFTCWGAAIVAGKATGAITDMRGTALRSTSVEHVDGSDDEAHSLYRAHLVRYRRWTNAAVETPDRTDQIDREVIGL